jgi:DUF917 family protein
MLVLWFAYYVIKNATETVSTRMIGYIISSARAQICGNFTPTLSKNKCYVIIDGKITEVNRKKKYGLQHGELTEAIEDNWCVL